MSYSNSHYGQQNNANKVLPIIVIAFVIVLLGLLMAYFIFSGNCRQKICPGPIKNYSPSETSTVSKQFQEVNIYLDQGFQNQSHPAFQLAIKEINLGMSNWQKKEQNSEPDKAQRIKPVALQADTSNLKLNNSHLHFILSPLSQQTRQSKLMDRLVAYIKESGKDNAIGVAHIKTGAAPFYLLIIGQYGDVLEIFEKLNNSPQGLGLNGKAYLNPKHFTIYAQKKIKNATTFVKKQNFLDDYIGNNAPVDYVRSLVPGVIFEPPNGKEPQEDEPAPEKVTTYIKGAKENRGVGFLAQDSKDIDNVIELRALSKTEPIYIRQALIFALRKYVPQIQQISTNQAGDKIILTKHDPCKHNKCNSDQNPDEVNLDTFEDIKVSGQYNSSSEFKALMSQPQNISQTPIGKPCHPLENICSIKVRIPTSDLFSQYVYHAHLEVYPSARDQGVVVDKIYKSHLAPQDYQNNAVLKIHQRLLDASVPTKRELLAEFDYYFKTSS